MDSHSASTPPLFVGLHFPLFANYSHSLTFLATLIYGAVIYHRHRKGRRPVPMTSNSYNNHNYYSPAFTAASAGMTSPTATETVHDKSEYVELGDRSSRGVGAEMGGGHGQGGRNEGVFESGGAQIVQMEGGGERGGRGREPVEMLSP